MNLQFYCTVALDTTDGLGSDQNSVVGQASQIYAGSNQMVPAHGSTHFIKSDENTTQVEIGQVGAWLQHIVKHDR